MQIPAVTIPLILALIAVFISGISTNQKPREGFRIAGGILLAISLIGVGMYIAATNHGAIQSDLKTLNIPWVIDGILNSHTESKIKDPEDLNDCVIVYYKFQCSDCRDVYPDLQQWLKNNQTDVKIYYVASNSDQGKDLLKKYPTGQVPSMIYIHPNGETFLARKIYQETDEKSVLDTEAIEQIFDYRKGIIS